MRLVCWIGPGQAGPDWTLGQAGTDGKLGPMGSLVAGLISQTNPQRQAGGPGEPNFALCVASGTRDSENSGQGWTSGAASETGPVLHLGFGEGLPCRLRRGYLLELSLLSSVMLSRAGTLGMCMLHFSLWLHRSQAPSVTCVVRVGGHTE